MEAKLQRARIERQREAVKGSERSWVVWQEVRFCELCTDMRRMIVCIVLVRVRQVSIIGRMI